MLNQGREFQLRSVSSGMCHVNSFMHFFFMFEFPCIVSLYYIRNQQDATLAVSFIFSLFHRAFRFTKFYLYQRMHLFLSYTKIT